MSQVGFIDTTLRDGQQSLWAMNMRTRHMVPALPSLDAAGFDQIELMAPGAAFKKFVRHHGENPWDWVKAAVKGVTHSQLRWHGRFEGSSLSGGIPPEVGELMIAKVVGMGIKFTRIGDNWNRIALLRGKKERLEKLGMTPTVNVMYSVSARHTDDYFIERARQAADLQPYRICLKDVGGLLTPERTRDLVPKLLAQTGDIPWEFHGHCNNGLGPLNALEAVKAGVRYVHTAVPPLANGNSQPSIFNVARNLQALGYDAPIDLEALQPAQRHLTAVARREGFPEGRPHEYREHLYTHQVPGGMISNLIYQLELAGLGNRIEETLEEAGQVRADFGYPIMVTPLSQFVGSQAAINVILGERYKQVSDDVIHYAWGRHGGEDAIAGMDPAVRAKILDRPRARELEHYEEPLPTLRELRHKYGKNTSDEELILRAIVGDDAAEVVRRGSKAEAAADARPFAEVLRDLMENTTYRYVSLEGPEVSMKLRRGDTTPA